MTFMQALWKVCFGLNAFEEQAKMQKKHAAYLHHLEKQLDKEQELGFQRHFATTGRRLRRACNKVDNV